MLCQYDYLPADNEILSEVTGQTFWTELCRVLRRVQKKREMAKNGIACSLQWKVLWKEMFEKKMAAGCMLFAEFFLRSLFDRYFCIKTSAQVSFHECDLFSRM
jgi:hypothetical protein